jgi:hypothetical protein
LKEASEHSYAADHNILNREGWLKLVKDGEGGGLLTTNLRELNFTFHSEAILAG